MKNRTTNGIVKQHVTEVLPCHKRNERLIICAEIFMYHNLTQHILWHIREQG